jgi:hypothetical protein
VWPLDRDRRREPRPHDSRDPPDHPMAPTNPTEAATAGVLAIGALAGPDAGTGYLAVGLAADRVHLKAVAARLLECLASDGGGDGAEETAPALPFAPDVADLSLACAQAIQRHYHIVDPSDGAAEGPATLELRAVEFQRTLERTGLDRVLTRIIEIKNTLWHRGGRDDCKLRVCAALVSVYVRAVYARNPAVKGDRYPAAMNNWQMIPGGCPEDTQEWMLESQLPQLVELMADKDEDPVIRSAACWWSACNNWGCSVKFCRRMMKDFGYVEVAVGLIAEL